MYESKIIKDSICNGFRLTTMQVTHPLVVHAEFMTHCMFARNASSSRAIPFKKVLEKVQQDPYIPTYWGKNQPGMQAKEELQGDQKILAQGAWLAAKNYAIVQAQELHDLGLHKQIVNRLLGPWMWITCCVTGDEGAWSNYCALRCHPDADPAIQKQAFMVRDAYSASVPEELEIGSWHLPYVDANEFTIPTDTAKVSVGRCARVSYLTQEGKRDPKEDIALHDRLVNSTPMHASPFEHVAKARGGRFAKYAGWESYRHTLEGEYTTDYFKERAAK